MLRWLGALALRQAQGRPLPHTRQAVGLGTGGVAALALSLLATALTACHETSPPAARPPARDAAATSPVVAPAPAPSAPRDAGPALVEAPARDVAGLRVSITPGGNIRLQGRDRWGGDVSTTYESAEYLERALPALARNVTPEQLEGLRALARELRRDGG